VRDPEDPLDPTLETVQRPDTSEIRGRVLQEALAEAGFVNPHLGAARPKTWAPLLGRVPLFIVREAFSAEAFYILLTGKATVLRCGAADVGLSRGDFFGELALLDQAERTASVVADTDLWTARIPRESFFDLLDHQPTIARGLLVALAERVRRLESERPG
jgi:hypothetical protein